MIVSFSRDRFFIVFTAMIMPIMVTKKERKSNRVNG